MHASYTQRTAHTQTDRQTGTHTAPVRLSLLRCTVSENDQVTSVPSRRVGEPSCILCGECVCERVTSRQRCGEQCAGNRALFSLRHRLVTRQHTSVRCHSNVALAVLARWQCARIPRRCPALVAKFNHLECYEAGVIPNACGPYLSVSRVLKS